MKNERDLTDKDRRAYWWRLIPVQKRCQPHLYEQLWSIREIRLIRTEEELTAEGQSQVQTSPLRTTGFQYKGLLWSPWCSQQKRVQRKTGYSYLVGPHSWTVLQNHHPPFCSSRNPFLGGSLEIKLWNTHEKPWVGYMLSTQNCMIVLSRNFRFLVSCPGNFTE